MRFHVLGLGPIGSLLSHHLRRVLPPTHSITLIHKTQHSARDAYARGGAIRIEHDGLLATASGFKSEVFQGPVQPKSTTSSAKHAEDRDESNTIESLFVATKAHQTLPAIRRLLPRLSPHSTIVLLQNGMGMYEQLVDELFRNPEARPHFVLASNTHGAYVRTTSEIVHTGVGEIHFGLVPDPGGHNFENGFFDDTIPRLERRPHLKDIALPTDSTFARYKSLRNTVAALLLLEPLRTSWLPMAQVQTAMRRKLVVNSVINPLTAIMNCRNGDILGTNSGLGIMRQVCHEASKVYAAQARAEAQAFINSSIAAGLSEEDLQLERLPNELTSESLQAECLRVAELTSGNISSMLADVRRGRPTEIQYLNGYLVQLGKTHKLRCPTTLLLTQLVNMRSAIPLDQML